MSRKLPESYPMYDTVYGSEVPTEQYYVVLFDRLPSKYVNTSNYDPTINESIPPPDRRPPPIQQKGKK
jgi:hypothetical protein